jgi:hypothetical protein
MHQAMDCLRKRHEETKMQGQGTGYSSSTVYRERAKALVTFAGMLEELPPDTRPRLARVEVMF